MRWIDQGMGALPNSVDVAFIVTSYWAHTVARAERARDTDFVASFT